MEVARLSGSSTGDPQEHFERIAPLARGPKGEQGEPGRRGERGLSRIQGRAVVILFLLAVLIGAAGLFWTSHEVSAQQGKWCSLIVTLDQANAAAPKKPAAGTFTAEFVAEIRGLRQSLGCAASDGASGGKP
jgi:hypothetical protein